MISNCYDSLFVAICEHEEGSGRRVSSMMRDEKDPRKPCMQHVLMKRIEKPVPLTVQMSYLLIKLTRQRQRLQTQLHFSLFDLYGTSNSEKR
jgi:hypothetical protein